MHPSPDQFSIPNDLLQALLASIIVLMPLITRALVKCLELRIAVLEAKIDRNTKLTQRNADLIRSSISNTPRQPRPSRSTDPPPSCEETTEERQQ
jgi:hypothetical protein